jgi:hypothetical protein
MNSMTEFSSKRVCDRYECCFAISCTRFNSTQYFQGRMENYSQNGLYFESESALQPGTTILTRVLKNLDADYARKVRKGFRSVALGEVKWCKEIISESSTYYGVGVRYYEPEY